MQENKKKWMELCEQAADEQDPKKLPGLILKINFILEAKELRLKGKLPTAQAAVEARLAGRSTNLIWSDLSIVLEALERVRVLGQTLFGLDVGFMVVCLWKMRAGSDRGASATVDHSDIRGSKPHNRDPSGAASTRDASLAESRSHRFVEDSPFPCASRSLQMLGWFRDDAARASF